MNKKTAIAALRSEADAARALGAMALYLFRSTARDEAGDESDVDLFIDYDEASRFSLVELVDIKHLLERRLGVQVDVTARTASTPSYGRGSRHPPSASFEERLVRSFEPPRRLAFPLASFDLG